MAKPESNELLFDILYSCRAMRRLKPDPVPEALLLQLVDAALQGPSGSNAQNWTFVIVRDRALTTPHFFVPGDFERILGIPKSVTLAAIIPVGYPLGKFGPVRRPAPQAVVSWDRYGA